jgi:hypothetical protein
MLASKASKSTTRAGVGIVALVRPVGAISAAAAPVIVVEAVAAIMPLVIVLARKFRRSMVGSWEGRSAGL